MYDSLFERIARETSTKIGNTIEESYNSKKNRMLDDLCEIFTEQINFGGSQNRYVEKMVEEYYYQNMERRIEKVQKDLEENLLTELEVLSKKIKYDPNSINSSLGIFENEMNRIKKSFARNVFEEENEDFIYEFSRKASYKYGEISSRAEEIIRYDISSEMQKYLDRKTEKISNEIYASVSKEIEKAISNANDVVDIMKEDIAQKEATNNINNIDINKHANLFGYTYEDGVLSSIDNAFDFYKVKNTENGLTSADSKVKIGLVVENDKAIFTDPKKNKKITFSQHEVKIESLYSNNCFEMKKDSTGIKYFYNEKELTKPEEQRVVIERIERDYPNLYGRLISNANTKEQFDQVKEASRKSEIYSDGLKINPDKHDEFIKRMFIAGYTIEEKDGQVFAIDSKTGEKDRLIDTKYGLKLEHNENVNIVTDLTIISKSISAHHLEVRKGSSSLLTTPNFDYFSYWDYENKKDAKIEINENNEIRFSGKDITPEEAKELFERECPNVIKFINQKVKWEDFKIVDENEKKIEPKNVEEQEVNLASIPFGEEETKEQKPDIPTFEEFIKEKNIDQSSIPFGMDSQDLDDGVIDDIPQEIEEEVEEKQDTFAEEMFEELENTQELDDGVIDDIPQEVEEEVEEKQDTFAEEMFEELENTSEEKSIDNMSQEEINNRIQELSENAAVKEFMALLAMQKTQYKMQMEEQTEENNVGRKI